MSNSRHAGGGEMAQCYEHWLNSCRDPGFESQNPRCSYQLSVTPVPEDPAPYSALNIA